MVQAIVHGGICLFLCYIFMLVSLRTAFQDNNSIFINRVQLLTTLCLHRQRFSINNQWLMSILMTGCCEATNCAMQNAPNVGRAWSTMQRKFLLLTFTFKIIFWLIFCYGSWYVLIVMSHGPALSFKKLWINFYADFGIGTSLVAQRNPNFKSTVVRNALFCKLMWSISVS